jgi:hypothetical protein
MVLPPDQERALRERVAEQTRLEQAGDVGGLCDLIVPALLWGEARARSAESFGRFVSHVRSAELVSFEVERWMPTLEVALVRYAVRYNEAPEPVSVRTFWRFIGGEWYATAAGKVWPAEPDAASDPAT